MGALAVSLREVATSFLVGALLAGLAVGGYLWWDAGGGLGSIFGDDAKTVEPGSFTHFEDGFMVGAEQHASADPLNVTVETADPEDDASLDYYGDAIQNVDRAWEIHTGDVKEGVDWRPARQGSTFVAALPVPDDFDEDHLAALRFEYSEHTIHALPIHGEPQDTWSYKQGHYHPGEDVFLVTLGSIGSPEYPTRLMVVEHAFKETQTVDGPIESPWSGPRETGASTDSTEASVASFSPLEPARATFDPLGEVVDADPTGAEGFQPICHASPCNMDREIRGYTIETRLNALKQALQDAVETYEGLDGQTGPLLEQAAYDLNGDTVQAYEYNLHGPQDPTISDPDSLISDFSHPSCAGELPNAWYSPSGPSVNLCLNTVSVLTPERTIINSLAALKSFAAHELHHAYQEAYTSETGDSAVFEGTARWAQDTASPTALSGWEFPPSMETSGAEPENEYKMEHLFFHLFSHEKLKFSQLGGLYQQGMGFEDLDSFIAGRTSHDGLPDAYWAFTKDLLYEDRSPSVRAPGETPGTCELYEMDIADVPEEPGVHEPHVPEPIEVEERTVEIDTSGLVVNVGVNTNTIPKLQDGLSSDVYELDFDPGADPEQGVWVSVTLESPDAADDPEMRMKLYDAENEGTEECWDDDKEAELGESTGIEVWEGDEEATLLVSNLEHGRSAPYRLVFEAFPMWSQSGLNGQRTYYIETPQGTRELTTMSGPTAEFQQDEEPGSLVWSVDAHGGISRPSYAFGNVYTVYGQGGFPASFGMTDAPEDRIEARDGETGELVWKTIDGGGKLDIGGTPLTGVLESFTDLQHEVIAGNGRVYVPGTHVGDFYPPQDPQCREPVMGTVQGVLAFDADDGSLSWEGTTADPPHEKSSVQQIALDNGTLYAKGTHTKFVKKDKLTGERTSAQDSCEADRPYYWDTVTTQKLWRIPSDGGKFEEVWSAPYNRSEMVVADGQAIIAGWGWPPSEAPAAITAVDLDTGEPVWSHEDPFYPPPPIGENEDAENYTADVTQLAYDEGTVFVGTMIRTPDNLRGAVYAYDGSDRQWRYETDEMSPRPAVSHGTVYAMTGNINISDEEEDPQDPSDVVEQTSVLHAVDAAANETRWAVDASTTMTVTDDRIYVGKRAPIGDPMGSSVAALNRTTGQVVWVNEDDVNGPGAATGAFVDGVLYVNTGAELVALHG